MEPFDYPDNDPGPQTLLTSLPTEQNIDRLHWLMSRFQGYVGVISCMGARFTASEQALKPVLNDAAKRGLIYVDDGASSRSIAGQIAGAQNMPFAKADVVIDAVPTPTEIDHALRAAGDGGARERQRRRACQRAAGDDRAHRRLGQEGRGPRLRAGADQHGGAEGEVVVMALSRARRVMK